MRKKKRLIWEDLFCPACANHSIVSIKMGRRATYDTLSSLEERGYKCKKYHRIIDLEGAYKAIESNPLLNAGIKIKGHLPCGCLNFS